MNVLCATLKLGRQGETRRLYWNELQIKQVVCISSSSPFLLCLCCKASTCDLIEFGYLLYIVDFICLQIYFYLLPEWLHPSAYLRRHEIDESCHIVITWIVVVSSFWKRVFLVIFHFFFKELHRGGGRWKEKKKKKETTNMDRERGGRLQSSGIVTTGGGSSPKAD